MIHCLILTAIIGQASLPDGVLLAGEKIDVRFESVPKFDANISDLLAFTY